MTFEIKDIFLMLEKYKLLILFISIFISNILTFFFSKSLVLANTSTEIEIVETEQNIKHPTVITVDVSGAVKFPGVYSLPESARINDAIALSGGISEKSSQAWVLRNLNLSQTLLDAQKIYIPFETDTEELCKNKPIETLIGTIGDVSENTTASPQSNSTDNSLVNINTSSKQELDTLPGIGEVYATKIIENRPYKDIQEFQTKTKIPQSVITKISSLITFE